MRGSLTVAAVLLTVASGACSTDPEPALLPIPSTVEENGDSYQLGPTSTLSVPPGDDTGLGAIVERWAASIREGSGLPLPVTSQGTIRVRVDTSIGHDEGYRIDITSAGVEIDGGGPAGVFYALQTLGQLLPPGVADGVATARPPYEIAALRIEDAPRFAYRGMHLDVARHFHGPDFVKRYIDMLARYKLNRFHWHLTEDQGWRIQIDRYPRLTQVGSVRAETHLGHGRDEFVGDGIPHGGFYTKDEIREIVAYAAERFVTIVPEIEMPGHSLAALAAYPELACTDGPFEVATTWGVFEDIYCPTEETFTFLENVLTEVIELFPGELVHVGGDEAPKARWQESPYVQALMEREGLADEQAVQGWFIARIERFLNANGRRLIGWDEILEGGLAPNATVMSWRGSAGGIEAARLGRDVVMTPNSHLYFDYYQSEDQSSEPLAIGGFVPLETVYGYDPVPEELTADEARRVLGAQANVWTEYMKTGEHVEYMVFPRMFALSEVVWSRRDRRDFEGFVEGLRWHLARLDALGVRYRPLDR